MIAGLKYHGNNVHLYSDFDNRLHTGDKENILHKTYFEGRNKVSIKELEDLLEDLVKDKDKREDFVSLLILYLFSVFLFPATSSDANVSLIPYAHALDDLSKYAWAFPVHEMLMHELVSASSRLQDNPRASITFGGCSIAVTVSFFFCLHMVFLYLHMVLFCLHMVLLCLHILFGELMSYLFHTSLGLFSGADQLPAF